MRDAKDEWILGPNPFFLWMVLCILAIDIAKRYEDRRNVLSQEFGTQESQHPPVWSAGVKKLVLGLFDWLGREEN